MIQALTDNDIPVTDIIPISPHQNFQSVTNYSVVPENLKFSFCDLHLLQICYYNVESPELNLSLDCSNKGVKVSTK